MKKNQPHQFLNNLIAKYQQPKLESKQKTINLLIQEASVSVDPQDSLIKYKYAESIIQSDQKINPRLQLLIKINIAICLYRLNSIQEALSIFQTTLKSLKKYSKLKSQILLQICIILSEQGKHHEAHVVSVKCLKHIVKLICTKYLTFCEQASSSDQMRCLYSMLLERIITLPQDYLSFNDYQKIIQQLNKIKEEKKLLFQNFSLEPIFMGLDSTMVEQGNILWFIQIKLVRFRDFEDVLLTSTEMINLIGLLTNRDSMRQISPISIKQSNITSKYEAPLLPSENFLSHALEIAYLFLPHEMPIVGQIISVHDKFHGITKEVIYEDSKEETPNIETLLLQPLRGQLRCGFFVPIIRKLRHYSQSQSKDIISNGSRQRKSSFNSRNANKNLRPLETDILELEQDYLQGRTQTGKQPFRLPQQQNSSWFSSRAASSEKKKQNLTMQQKQAEDIQNIYLNARQGSKKMNKQFEIHNRTIDVNSHIDISEFLKASEQFSCKKPEIQINNQINVIVNQNYAEREQTKVRTPKTSFLIKQQNIRI